MTTYTLTEKEQNWVKKNNFDYCETDSLCWYNNPQHYTHEPKNQNIVGVHKFYIQVLCKGAPEVYFECGRYDYRTNKPKYNVCFRETINSTLQQAFSKLENKIKRFPDKEVYKLWNKCFVTKEF